MSEFIPEAIRCSYNFPGHTPHWGRVRNQMTQSRRESGQRIMSVVQNGPTSLLVATQYGTVMTYFNHQPDRLVAIWHLHPEGGRLYRAEGLIGVRHRERIADKNADAEYMFSIAASGVQKCQDIARSSGVLKAIAP